MPLFKMRITKRLLPEHEKDVYKGARQFLYERLIQDEEYYKVVAPSLEAIAPALASFWEQFTKKPWLADIDSVSKAIRLYGTQEKVYKYLREILYYVPATWNIDEIPNRTVQKIFEGTKQYSQQILIHKGSRECSTSMLLEFEGGESETITLHAYCNFYINPWPLVRRSVDYTVPSNPLSIDILAYCDVSAATKNVEPFEFSTGGVLGTVYFFGALRGKPVMGG